MSYDYDPKTGLVTLLYESRTWFIFIMTIIVGAFIFQITKDKPREPSLLAQLEWQSFLKSTTETQRVIDETRSSQEMDDARNVRQETVHTLVSDVVNDVSQEISQTTFTMTDEQLIAAIRAAIKKEIEHKSSLQAGASSTRLSVNLEKCKLNLELKVDKQWFNGKFNPGDIDLCNIGNVILKSIKAIYPIIPICIITNKSFSPSECRNLIVEAVMQDKKIQAEIAKPTKT